MGIISILKNEVESYKNISKYYRIYGIYMNDIIYGKYICDYG